MLMLLLRLCLKYLRRPSDHILHLACQRQGALARNPSPLLIEVGNAGSRVGPASALELESLLLRRHNFLGAGPILIDEAFQPLCPVAILLSYQSGQSRFDKFGSVGMTCLGILHRPLKSFAGV